MSTVDPAPGQALAASPLSSGNVDRPRQVRRILAVCEAAWAICDGPGVVLATRGGLARAMDFGQFDLVVWEKARSLRLASKCEKIGLTQYLSYATADIKAFAANEPDTSDEAVLAGVRSWGYAVDDAKLACALALLRLAMAGWGLGYPPIQVDESPTPQEPAETTAPEAQDQRGLSPAKFAAAVGTTTRTVERWTYENRILPAFRTPGGHARFSEAQVAPAQKHLMRRRYWQKVGPNGEDLGLRGVQPWTARFDLDARNWAKHTLLMRRVRAIKVSPDSPEPDCGYQEMPWSRGKKVSGQ